MTSASIWQAKVCSRVHDPADKALALADDPGGTAGGHTAALARYRHPEGTASADPVAPDDAEAPHAGLFPDGVPRDLLDAVVRAERWAGAADRPDWPLADADGEVAEWARVSWREQPRLIHPLDGAQIDLGELAGAPEEAARTRYGAHVRRCIVRDGDAVDWHKTALALWRFAPEPAGAEAAHWRMLPADPRVPDTTLWDHLDLTAGFAGAFTADTDGSAALLTLSLGPVQPFIAAARSTSDFWAGSHLLARLSWEAMRVVCERYGPDAVLFPRLRGVPEVDRWLRDEVGLPRQWFEGLDWTRRATDANPLFAAALPNRFVAVVPEGEARALVEAVKQRLAERLQAIGDDVVDRLLALTGGSREADAYAQMREQIRDFPEVHWSAVPFSLVAEAERDGARDLDASGLNRAMAPFYGADEATPCGFLASEAWRVLRDVRLADGTRLLTPNAGFAYPAVYELGERTLAAAKAVRPFSQRAQHGWRDSLTGEVEWLTEDRDQLGEHYGRRKDTLWARVAQQKPAWAKRGEHLGALSAIKRLWPNLVAEETARAADRGDQADRFVVSTHAMALAAQLDTWLAAGGEAAAGFDAACRTHGCGPVALPRALARRHGHKAAFATAKRLPALLDAAEETDDPHEAERLKRLVRDSLATAGAAGGDTERYYALLLFDGDHMGGMLSGEPDYAIRFGESFHPGLRARLDEHAPGGSRAADYAAQPRPVSPARHLQISGALNDFALHVVPEVVEGEHAGRLMYAGGDDVQAMLPVPHLLPCMRRLRHGYSGIDPDATVRGQPEPDPNGGLACGNGFALLGGRLMRMMGQRATASCGAVVAHHQAPLPAVMRALWAAEQRAKQEGGRDAFHITVIKRAGGAIHLTAKWGEPMAVLIALRDFLAEPPVSRRAVYNSLTWLKDLPDDADDAMVATLLGDQLQRQAGDKQVVQRHGPHRLAHRAARLAGEQPDRHDWLEALLTTAEFLAREARAPAAEGEASVEARSASV